MRQVAEHALVAKVFSVASGYTPAKGDEVELSGVLEVNKPSTAGSKKCIGEVVAIEPCAIGGTPTKVTVLCRGAKVRTRTAGGAITAGAHVALNSTGAKVLALVEDGAPAGINTGVVGNNNALTFTTPLRGRLANLITFELRDPGVADQALAVVRKGGHVDIALATGADPGKAITSTAALVKAAIEANAQAAKVLAAAHTATSTGAGVVVAVAVQSFTAATEADDPRCSVGLALETAEEDGDSIQVLER